MIPCSCGNTPTLVKRKQQHGIIMLIQCACGKKSVEAYFTKPSDETGMTISTERSWAIVAED
jgi:hypothetical protein